MIEKLSEAGAVLTAKLTLGALAWGDVWYGGKTRNPFNLHEGSSGSSAGSASATAAGLCAFSIGTDTAGNRSFDHLQGQYPQCPSYNAETFKYDDLK